MFDYLNSYSGYDQKTNEDTEVCQNTAKINVIDEESAKQALSASLHARKLRCSIVERKQMITKSFLIENEAELSSLKVMIDSLQKIEDQLKEDLTRWVFDRNKEDAEKISTLEVDEGKLYCKDDWEFKIEDFETIPRKYMIVDHKKIQEDIKKGIRNLQGISIFRQPSVTFRIKN